jgi:hypothetical protein
MRINYDSEVDALCIRLLEGEYQCRTRSVITLHNYVYG